MSYYIMLYCIIVHWHRELNLPAAGTGRGATPVHMVVIILSLIIICFAK